MSTHKHYVQQDAHTTRILPEGEQWSALKGWYVANGFDFDTTVNTGSTIVKDGKLYVTTLKPIEGQTSARVVKVNHSLTEYEYWLPVTPLPEDVLS